MIRLNEDGGPYGDSVRGYSPGRAAGSPSTIEEPYQFADRFGGLQGVLTVRECERALPLTRHQLEILKGLAFGLTNTEVGHALGVGSSTIHTLCLKIRDELGLDNLQELRVWAIKFFISLRAHGLEMVEFWVKRANGARREFVACPDGAQKQKAAA